jgi:hypothetical protein
VNCDHFSQNVKLSRRKLNRLEEFVNGCHFSLSPFTEVPISSPVIHGIRSRYKLGDIVRGNCTSKYSRPAANLTWTINDIIVSINISIRLSRPLLKEISWNEKPFFVLKLAENLCIHHSWAVDDDIFRRLTQPFMPKSFLATFPKQKLCGINDLITLKLKQYM